MPAKTKSIRTKSNVKLTIVNTNKTLKAISLFSGMGGDSLGMKMAGVDVIAYNEFDKHAIASHEANFPGCQLIVSNGSGGSGSGGSGSGGGSNDIAKVEDEVLTKYNGVVDLIFAGFPCQGFSHGGKKLPEDPRNTLFREFVRVANNVRPKFVIGENVDGLLSRKTADGRNFIDVIQEAFDEIGYTLTWKVCHAVKHGVPQLRKRLIIVGVRNDVVAGADAFEFPEELNDGKTGSLPNLTNIVRYDLTGCAEVLPSLFDFADIPDECIMRNMDDDTLPVGGKDVHPYVRMKLDTDLSTVPFNSSGKNRQFNSLLSFGKRESPYHLEIVDVRAPSKTIICTYDHQPRLLVPVQNKTGSFVRTLLPDELKQIQGFPADFIVCGNVKQQIKQIGNAVPPPLIAEIVKQIRKIYEE